MKTAEEILSEATGYSVDELRERITEPVLQPYDCLTAMEKYAEMVEKNSNLQNVSVSLLHKKAVEYAKFIHQEEFDDPCFAPDVEQTIRAFKSGFEAAIRYSNER